MLGDEFLSAPVKNGIIVIPADPALLLGDEFSTHALKYWIILIHAGLPLNPRRKTLTRVGAL